MEKRPTRESDESNLSSFYEKVRLNLRLHNLSLLFVYTFFIYDNVILRICYNNMLYDKISCNLNYNNMLQQPYL